MVEEQKMRDKIAVLDREYNQIKVDIVELTHDKIFDQLQVQRLKKRKLNLKDQITYLRTSLCDDIIA